MDSPGSVTARLQPMPLLPLLLGVIGGIAINNATAPCHDWLDIALLAFVLTATIITAFMRRPRALTLFAGAFLGWCASFIARPLEFDQLPAEDTVYEGVVTKINRTSSFSIFIDIDGEVIGDTVVPVAPFRLCAYPGDGIANIVEGSIVTVSGDYSYPKIETTLPMENDLSQMYASQGVSLVCFAKEDRIKPVGMSRNPIYALARTRQNLSDKYFDSHLTPDAAAFFSAITTGDTSALDPDKRANFAAAGLAHILALSGAHLAVIAAIISLLLIPITFAGGYRLRWWISIIILWLYAAITGLSPSVVRATVMITAVMVSILADRPHSSLNALCAAAIAILLCKPASLTMPGFQLSFAATLSIILFSNSLNPFTYKENKRRAALSFIIVTLAATIGTAPLVAWHFHQLPIYFLPANLIAMLLLPLAIFSGLLFLTLSTLGIGTVWLCWCMNLMYKVLNIIVAWLTALPGATISGLYFPAWMLIPIYITLASLCIYIWHRRIVYLIGFLLFTIFTAGMITMMQPQNSPYGIYLASHYSHTELIAHHRDTLTIFTTDNSLNFSADSAQWHDRYRDYIGSRGIHHLEVRPATTAGIISHGTHTYKFSTDTTAAHIPTTYTILLRPTLGNPAKPENILGVADAVDTILIARDINRGPLTRLLHFLTTNNIPHRRL